MVYGKANGYIQMQVKKVGYYKNIQRSLQPDKNVENIIINAIYFTSQPGTTPINRTKVIYLSQWNLKKITGGTDNIENKCPNGPVDQFHKSQNAPVL